MQHTHSVRNVLFGLVCAVAGPPRAEAPGYAGDEHVDEVPVLNGAPHVGAVLTCATCQLIVAVGDHLYDPCARLERTRMREERHRLRFVVVVLVLDGSCHE